MECPTCCIQTFKHSYKTPQIPEIEKKSNFMIDVVEWEEVVSIDWERENIFDFAVRREGEIQGEYNKVSLTCVPQSSPPPPPNPLFGPSFKTFGMDSKIWNVRTFEGNFENLLRQKVYLPPGLWLHVCCKMFAEIYLTWKVVDRDFNGRFSGIVNRGRGEEEHTFF